MRQTASVWQRLFHWTHSGVLLPFLFGSGIAMMGVGASLNAVDWPFDVAYVFFVLGMLWFLGFWLTSDYLSHKNPDTWTRAARKKYGSTRRARAAYWAWKYLLCLAIVVSSALCIIGTHRAQLTKHLTAVEDGLVPANDPDLKTECDQKYPLPEQAIRLYLGSCRFSAVPAFFPWAVLETQDRVPVLTFERDKHGHIGITLDVRDSSHRIIARIERNQFIINPNNILTKRQPDRSTLIILDQEGNEVVRCRYMNEHSIRFTGRFYVDGLSGPVVIDDKLIMAGDLGYGDLCEPYHETSAVQLVLPTRKPPLER